MWNVHAWCDLHEIGHFYSIEEDVNTFSGVRMQSDSVFPDCAILSDEPGNSQYRSVLSYGRDRIYFLQDTARSIMKLLNEMFSSYLDWERTMIRICVSRGSLSSLLSAGRTILTFPILILCRGEIIASSEDKSGGVEQLSRFILADKIEHLAQFANQIEGAESPDGHNDLPLLLPSPFSSGGSVLIDHLEVRDTVFWIIASDGTRKLVYGDVFHIRLLHDVLAKYLPEMITQLDDSPPSTPEQDYAEADSRSYCVYRIESVSGRPSLLNERIYKELQKRRPGDRIAFAGSGLILVSGSSASDTLPDCAFFDSFIPKGSCFIGESWHYPDLSGLSCMLQQSYRAASAARKKAVRYETIRNCSAQLIRSVFYNTPEIQSYVHPFIRHLDALDRKSSAPFPYLRTLESYLAHGGNFYATARELSINRNTLVNRITRLESIGDCSLQDPDLCEILYLSLLIYDRRPQFI